ncbi:MAG: acyl-CoA dehydrogenase family protein [Deltaproteobacteria bacterium]|nr:acyl-CoA dehydrogenase family protein [Deltaproteobacteria bacterium]
MEFEFTEEQRMIQDTVRRFAEKEIGPLAAEVDRTERFPKETLKKMAELGLMSLLVPEEAGGTSMGAVAYSLVLQEIGRACASHAVITSVTNMVCEGIYRFGTPAQKARCIPKIASGEYPAAAFALTEPGAGSDAGSLRATAERRGDEYVLNGTKIFITSGTYAGVMMVAAKTNREAGSKGISVFLVEQGTPGLKVGRKEEKLGQRGSDTVEIILEECRVPVENLLGNEGDGFRIMLASLGGGRVGIASNSCGLGRAAFEAARVYARERKQFGRPIADFQAIQFKIADMATQLDAATLLTLRAADLKEKGLPCNKEASMAKLIASETAQRICREAIQIHGGYGYVNEYPVERYLRDAMVLTLYEGTSEVQRIVIARDVLAA